MDLVCAPAAVPPFYGGFYGMVSDTCQPAVEERQERQGPILHADTLWMGASIGRYSLPDCAVVWPTNVAAWLFPQDPALDFFFTKLFWFVY